jgi:hypothetical protein
MSVPTGGAKKPLRDTVSSVAGGLRTCACHAGFGRHKLVVRHPRVDAVFKPRVSQNPRTRSSHVLSPARRSSSSLMARFSRQTTRVNRTPHEPLTKKLEPSQSPAPGADTASPTPGMPPLPGQRAPDPSPTQPGPRWPWLRPALPPPSAQAHSSSAGPPHRPGSGHSLARTPTAPPPQSLLMQGQ